MASGANWRAANADWTAVDALIESTLVPLDPALAACVELARDAGLPDIAVSPAQGRFLQLLVTMSGTRRVLEIGTLGGFSTIFLARGLAEGGEVVSLEANPAYAEVARRNLAGAGLAEHARVVVGPALESLPDIEGRFDLFFIDADKVNNCAYFNHALRLANPGALILVDNAVREGRIIDPQPGDDAALGTRRLYDHVAQAGVEATVLQTVGEKGWDGMLIARVPG
jgi:predicted O-methyltransferase YrrM